MGLFDALFPGGIWGDDDSWKKAKAKKGGKGQAAKRVARSMGLTTPVDGTKPRPQRRRSSGGGRNGKSDLGW